MHYYRFGAKGDEVREIQVALGITADGIFGRMTEAAVKNYQMKNGIHPDGVVTPLMMEMLFGEDYSTDLSEKYNSKFDYDMHHLPKDEYVDEITQKEYIFLHHTKGSHNPYFVIDGWGKDQRGRIATEFVIGGKSLSGDEEFDGLIVQAFPDNRWAYHLGAKTSKYLQKHSIGIELCNFGELTLKDGKFYNFLNRVVPNDQVCTLKEPYRGSIYYHNYTEAQIKALERLLLHLRDRNSIDLKKGLQEWLKSFSELISFDFFHSAMDGKTKGILSHTNIIKNHAAKKDVYPHPKLVEMIKNLK
jgi:hypothetical protein